MKVNFCSDVSMCNEGKIVEHYGDWKEKWHEFCLSVKWYKFIPKDIEDLFSHYLDCEAHSDVWREVYKTWNHTNETDKAEAYVERKSIFDN